MTRLITAQERHEAKVKEWLTSYYLFSFADYFDPANVQFGPLRVFNDDILGGRSGLPTHPHAEMEVLTIVIDGVLSHKDSIGNETAVKAGEVQRISAGTGITHSENNDADEPARFCQLWFLPNKKGLAPSYEHKALEFKDKKDELVPIATGQRVLEDVVFLNSNSTVYYGQISQGKEIDFKTFKIRKSLIYILDGSLLVNNMEMDKGDQARIEDTEIISMHGTGNATFILVDVPALEANY